MRATKRMPTNPMKNRVLHQHLLPSRRQRRFRTFRRNFKAVYAKQEIATVLEPRLEAGLTPREAGRALRPNAFRARFGPAEQSLLQSAVLPPVLDQ